MTERRGLRSIRTMRDVWGDQRKRDAALSGRKEVKQRKEFEFNIGGQHVVGMPPKESFSRPQKLDAKQNVSWTVDDPVEGDDGRFYIISQFKGIAPTDSFKRSKINYGEDSALYSAPITYRGVRTSLIIFTLGGSIFGFQILRGGAKDGEIDIQANPLAQESRYLSDMGIANPGGMRVFRRDNFVVAEYNSPSR